ncbi:hypothetical protein [Leifsonia aquatica]|uniref:hypothetical protein n=1 Tax=Leifsonia aquatica TaxID=144185 RepID=UPI00046AF4C7|nr:hypothetical protein [Leifsonia aquatica]
MATTDDAYFDLRLQVQVTLDEGEPADREKLYEAVKELVVDANPLSLETYDPEGEGCEYSIDVWELEERKVPEEQLRELADLAEAHANALDENWEHGDLAGAVRDAIGDLRVIAATLRGEDA